jgi:hypothetical protein
LGTRQSRLASALVLLTGLIGAVVYARVLDQSYPLKTWLAWQLALVWGAVLLFSVACASFGSFVLVRLLRSRNLPALQSALFAMAIGVVAFSFAMYVGGALALYGPVFSVLLPGCMFAVGAKDGLRLAERLLAANRARSSSAWTTLLGAAGVVCISVVYLGAMTPDALNYDSTWYHLVVAEEYARAGRIVPFLADYNCNYPQLTGLINTWGWTLPGLQHQPALRWMFALHSEVGLFLWTLFGVGAGIDALVAPSRPRSAWVSFFLFPAIFVYDHNIGGAADHNCAFFAVPILLATLRLSASFAFADAALLGITCAGALLAKYQAVYLIAPVTAIVGVCWLRRLLEHLGPDWTPLGSQRIPLRQLLRAPLWTAAFGLGFVAPHFIRLWVFYHNPVYPFMQDVFRSTPTLPNAAFMFERVNTEANYRPSGTFIDKLWHATKLFFTFSFHPHYSFTRSVPMFGSLFTLLLPTVLMVRKPKRIIVSALLASGAILMWGITYNVDRNLQVFAPVMACTTGALIFECFRLGWAARLGVTVLVALQVIWGADSLVYSEHDRIRSAFDLIRGGFEGRAESRFDGYRSAYIAVGEHLPRDARVLLHTSHISLGIDRTVYLDWHGYQGLIGYDALRTPAELDHYYRSLGITHLLYDVNSGFSAASKQEELLWHALLEHAVSLGQFGGLRLFALPKQPLAREDAYTVACIGIRGYRDGIYRIESLNTKENIPAEDQHYAKPDAALPGDDAARSEALSHVAAVFVGPMSGRRDADSEALRHRFSRISQLPAAAGTLYLKKH